jgi:hypothetical protein
MTGAGSDPAVAAVTAVRTGAAARPGWDPRAAPGLDPAVRLVDPVVELVDPPQPPTASRHAAKAATAFLLLDTARTHPRCHKQKNGTNSPITCI